MQIRVFPLTLLCALGMPAPGRPAATPAAADPPKAAQLDVRAFRIVEGSGPVYYRVLTSPDGPFIRADYRPGLTALTAGLRTPDEARQTAQRLRWRWRVQAFPREADQCRDGGGDSAATVFATFKRGLRWYIIKYVWNTGGPTGVVCDSRRTPTLVRETVVLESGGPTGVWREEQIDLPGEFRRLFEGGRPDAEVPDFVGVGIATDGDETHSHSAGDYGGFELQFR